MKKERKDKHFIKKPTYEGGLTAMRAFIKKNMKYPKAALKAKFEGTVFVKYTVDHKGNVISSKVVSSIGYGCDVEAKRLVSLLKFQVPKIRKMRIQYHKSIQIHFRLPKVAPKPKLKKPTNSGMQINYTTTIKKKDVKKKGDEDNQNSTGGSYNYTISF